MSRRRNDPIGTGQQSIRKYAMPRVSSRIANEEVISTLSVDLNAAASSQNISEPMYVNNLISPFDESSLPDVVASPHRPATLQVGSSGSPVDNSLVRGSGSEVSVSAGDELPAERDTYIPVANTVETNTALGDTVNWFCRSKKSVLQQIRRFYTTGKCMWNREVITDEGRLAAVFNSQAIEHCLRSLRNHRSYWHRMAQVGQPPAE